MQKMRRQISILLAALLVLTLLVGCGGSGSAKPAATGYAYDTDASTAPEAPMEQDSKFNITAVVADDALRDAKMIYRANIDLQTTDYETSEAAISNLVRSFGGFTLRAAASAIAPAATGTATAPCVFLPRALRVSAIRSARCVMWSICPPARRTSPKLIMTPTPA